MAVVCTHRDPVPVALSMVAMITYAARIHRSPVPVEKIAAAWIDRLELMLTALAAIAVPLHRSARSTCPSTISWPTNSVSPNGFTASSVNQ